jgi:hypothetical protein
MDRIDRVRYIRVVLEVRGVEKGLRQDLRGFESKGYKKSVGYRVV